MTLNEYVNSIKDKRIAVIGVGVSNTPLINLLLSCGCNVTVCDKRGLEEMGREALELINRGAKLKLGRDYLEGLDHDIIFRTPGLMPFDPHLEAAKARGSLITSEMASRLVSHSNSILAEKLPIRSARILICTGDSSPDIYKTR